MHEIRNKDLKLGALNGDGIPEFLELAERVTKTRRGTKAQGLSFPKLFEIYYFQTFQVTEHLYQRLPEMTKILIAVW